MCSLLKLYVQNEIDLLKMYKLMQYDFLQAQNNFSLMLSIRGSLNDGMGTCL